MRKTERGGRKKGEGRRGEGGTGWEGKFRGRGMERGGEGTFRGARPPKCFFLEPRLLL